MLSTDAGCGDHRVLVGGSLRPGLVTPVALLLCLSLSACGDLISDPDEVDVALPAREELVALIHGVVDVADRVAPQLSNAGAAAPLRSGLAGLVAALDAVDGPAADRSLRSLMTAHDAYVATAGISPEDLPELDAIFIALARVDGQLRRLCSRTPASSPAGSPVFSQHSQCITR